MEIQFENEGSSLKATVGEDTIKIISHTILESGGEYELNFEVEELTEPGEQNTVTFEGYNFEPGDTSNYECTVLEGGMPVITDNPGGQIKRPVGG